MPSAAEEFLDRQIAEGRIDIGGHFHMSTRSDLLEVIEEAYLEGRGGLREQLIARLVQVRTDQRGLDPTLDQVLNVVRSAAPPGLGIIEDWHRSIIDAAKRVIALPPHAEAYSTEDRRRIWTAQMQALIETMEAEFGRE